MKRAIDRHAADCLPPTQARDLIRDAACRAVQHLGDFRPYHYAPPITLEFDCAEHGTATLLARVPGTTLVEPNRVRFVSEHFRHVFDMIILLRFLLHVARQFYG